MLTQISTLPMMHIRIDPGTGVRAAQRALQSVSTNPNQGLPPSFEIEGGDEITPSEETIQPAQAPREGSEISFKLWEKNGFSFGDILDVINPLQHLPFVSTIYRSLTGDAIGAAPRILGGALYGRIGGIAGLISSVVNGFIGIITGKDIGEHVYSMLFGDPHTPERQPIMVGKASPDSPPLADGMLEVESLSRRDSGIPASGAPNLAVSALTELSVNPPSQALETLPTGASPVAPRPWVFNTLISELDIYEQMARVGVVAEEKAELSRYWP